MLGEKLQSGRGGVHIPGKVHIVLTTCAYFLGPVFLSFFHLFHKIVTLPTNTREITAPYWGGLLLFNKTILK